MFIRVIQNDNRVLVDGTSLVIPEVDELIPNYVHSFEYDDELGKGFIEYVQNSEEITSVSDEVVPSFSLTQNLIDILLDLHGKENAIQQKLSRVHRSLRASAEVALRKGEDVDPEALNSAEIQKAEKARKSALEAAQREDMGDSEYESTLGELNASR